MFYSQQILARKAPLGQIWMAATLKSKIDRRKLNKLDISRICEEILYPSIPMALRLTSILMGGVVIVYERKVNLVYDDAKKLVAEINQAFKIKPPIDRTLLPKGKSQAKRKDLTLPEIEEADDVGDDLEEYPNATFMGFQFQKTSYLNMRLDKVDDSYVNVDIGQENDPQDLHQANADTIQLDEPFDIFQSNTDTYTLFERFDIEGDEETQPNFTSMEHVDVEIPPTDVTSQPQQEAPRGPPEDNEVHDQHQENQVKEQPGDHYAVRQNKHRQKSNRKPTVMDYETMIPGHVYQSWLQDTTDVVSKRGAKRKACRDFMSTMKVTHLMELPPVVLADDLSNQNREIYYPEPLLELWRKSTKPLTNSPPGSNSQFPPLEPLSSSSPAGRANHQSSMGQTFEDIPNGAGLESLRFRPIEIIELENLIQTEFLQHLGANTINDGVKITEVNEVTPGNSGDKVISSPSLGSGNGSPSHHSEANSRRPNKKRPHSSDGNRLETVAEDYPQEYPDANFKFSRQSETDPVFDQEWLVETGPTPTQHPIISIPVDNITKSIRTHMKAHFEGPGSCKTISLNKLASGMNRTWAAKLFYQTCVLASTDVLKVQQEEPYGDILLSRGPKMC